MKAYLTAKFEYNGIFANIVEELKEGEYEEVTLIGVPVPVDPGIVAIKRNDKIEFVPTCVLKGIPPIDFKKLLTADQMQERKKVGFLFGSGFSEIDKKYSIIPIEKLVATA